MDNALQSGQRARPTEAGTPVGQRGKKQPYSPPSLAELGTLKSQTRGSTAIPTGDATSNGS